MELLILKSIILNIFISTHEMNETYDVVVCGTGLIECILSGLLSQEGKSLAMQARKCYTLTAILSTVERVPQSTSPTSGKFSERRRSPIRSSATTATGILIWFPSISCMVENLSRSSSKPESPNTSNGSVLIPIPSHRWYIRTAEQGGRLLLQGRT